MKCFRRKKIWGIFAFLLVFALSGLLVMLLWNALLPSIIGVGSVSYLQSLGIIILSRLLFGGMGHWGKHAMGHWGMHHHHNNKEIFAMHQKFHGMSEQERQDFIHKRMNDLKDWKNGGE